MIEKDTLYIDGTWTPSTGSDLIEVISPHTEEVIATVPDGTAADIDAAVAAARNTFDNTDWATMPPAERLDIVARFADLYAARMMDMAQVVTDEMGSPISFSQLAQAPAPWMMLNNFLELGRNWVWEESRTGMLGSPVIVRSEPVGVVAAIVPWNVPQFVTMSKLAPALVSGCTMVLKPAPETPLDASLMAELLHEAGVPAGVVNIVAAGREVGEHLVRHPGVDKVAFTGSTAAGRTIASICGEQLKRYSLELGGKSAAIILDDADLPSAAMVGFAVCAHSGQGCAIPTRMLLPRSRYDEGIEILAEAFRNVPFGDPTDPGNIQGPQISAKQRERVLGYIETGVKEGARLVVGGGRPAHLDKGWFVEPTLFADVDNSMTIAREEIFGPVLVVVPFDDDDDAVRIANDNQYGLAGMVTSASEERALAVASRIRAGSLSVNGGVGYGADAPFGGYKASGVGRQNGIEGFLQYLETKTIAVGIQ